MFSNRILGPVLRKQSFATKPGTAAVDVLASLAKPLILDVRDPNEVLSGKGGPPAIIAGSVNVPLNHECSPQRERATTAEEFLVKLQAAGVALPEDKSAAIITHCGSGGRGGRAATLLQDLGFTNVHNGGGPAHLYTALVAPE
jgi:rhodanese-related sulfurtransferase